MTARILKQKRSKEPPKVKANHKTKKVKNKQTSSIVYFLSHTRGVFIGVLIFVLVITVVVGYTQLELFLKRTLVSNIYTPTYSNEVFYGITMDNVDSITIKTVQESFTLKKNITNTTNIWTIDSKEISKDKIDRLFFSLYDFNQGSLLSKNPRNHLELGINDLLGSFVTIKSGSREVKFVIGNPSSVINSFYFRLQDSSEVYLSTGDLRNIITSGKSYWIE